MKPRWNDEQEKRAKEVLALARGGWRMGAPDYKEPDWNRMERNASYKFAARGGEAHAPATRQQARKHLREQAKRNK